MRTKKLRRKRQTSFWVATSFGYYQSFVVDRIIHFGCIFPRNHQGIHGSCNQWKNRSSSWLKENLVMGRLIPAGTGLNYYRNLGLKVLGEPTTVMGEIGFEHEKASPSISQIEEVTA
jgi:hypothetical protein